MKIKKLKRWVIPSVYLSAVLLTVGCIYALIIGVKSFFADKDDFNYSINGVNDIIPVFYSNEENNMIVNSETKIIKPYTDTNVKIGRSFYEVDDDLVNQENSIIFFENTYIQNTGVDYISDNQFDVVSILSGKVIEILTDENLGNIIKIEHDNDVVSIYEGVDNIKVKVGDDVSLGQVISSSGKSNINSAFEQSLHFEIYNNDQLVNPEKFILNYEKDNN